MPKYLLSILLLLLVFSFIACGDDDDNDDAGTNDDDAATDDDVVDDDVVDDDVADDDVVDDDVVDDDTTMDDDTIDDDTIDDDVIDDDTTPDDYMAPWPQENIEPADYDETGEAGDLRLKAEEYDQWHLDYHQPYAGLTIGTLFTDETRTEVANHFDWNDSCEWSGLYLGSQAMRYHVTGDAQAKVNALRVAAALSGNLHVTGKEGFIARYHAPQTALQYEGDEWCDENDRCHRVTSGEYDGWWWWGETSRDMYNGWFFGYALAYDLVDDEDLRDQIRADVIEVLDTLMSDNWMIIDEAGEPTTKAPNVMPPFRVAWLTIGYHITGEERFKVELQKWLRNSKRTLLQMLSITFMNRYVEYFGNCLSHEYWYNLLRLGKVYFSDDDYQFFLNLFNTQIHSFTRLSHNPWFNGVYMGQGGYEPQRDDPYLAQLLEDLTDFRDAPSFSFAQPVRDPSTYEEDPVSVFLADLLEQYPFLEGLLGDVKVQAKEAFPVLQQCSSDFQFQRNPFQIEACGTDDPTHVNPGVDYLISYWLASYHKFITKNQ